jgi:hypothetical protein
MFFIRDKYYKEAMEQAKKRREEEKMKERLLSRDMDYAFLEELVQKMNENPLLRIKVTLNDGTTIDLNTAPKKKAGFDNILEPHEDFLEVR